MNCSITFNRHSIAAEWPILVWNGKWKPIRIDRP